MHEAKARQSLNLVPGETYSGLGQWIEFWESPQGPSGFEDARLAHADGRFAPLDSSDPDFGFSRSTFWLRVQLTSAVPRQTLWIVDLQKPYLKSAEILLQRGGETERLLLDGTDIPFSERANPRRIIATQPFVLAASETTILWIRYASDVSTSLPIRLLDQHAFPDAYVAQEVSLAIYYAVAGMLAVFIIAMAVVLRSRVSVLYAAFFVFLLAFNAQINGTFFQFLWPGWPWFNSVIAHPISQLTICFAVLFGREFILFDTAPKWADRLALGVAFACIACAAMPLVIDIFIARRIGSILVLLVIIVQLVNAIIAFRYRRPGSTLFLTGAVVMLLYIGAFAVLLVFFPVSGSSNAYEFMRYGQLVDGCIFAMAVLRMTVALKRSERQALELASATALQLEETRHDLRQPLLTLREAVDRIAGDGSATEDATKQRLVRSVEYLESLLDGEQATRQPAGHSDAPHVTVSEVVESVLFMFSQDAKQAEISLTSEGRSDKIADDPVALLRMLANLVSNAIRHSRARSVSVSVSANPGRLEIGVKDDGTGLSKADLSRFQGDTASDPADAGKGGLGFGIVRQIADDRGWQLTVASTEGQGTTFSLAIPYSTS